MSIRTLSLAISAASLLATASFTTLAADPSQQDQGITQAFQQAIANAPGKSLTGVVVDYAPGAKSPPHSHGAAFVVAYVLSGAIRSKVNDGKEIVFHAGESWSENPGDHHAISENASDTEPAKLLAISVADTNDHNLVIWDTPKAQ